MTELRKPTDIPEATGERLVVYTNSFSGALWDCHHGMESDRILVNVTDEDKEDILPARIFKVDLNHTVISFDKSVNGNVSIFKITPLLKGKKIPINNSTLVRYRHDLHTTALICQCWRSNGELVLPEEVTVEDLDVINIRFHESFTGYAELVTPYPRQVSIDTETDEWIDAYRTDLNQNLIMTQTWQNYSLFLPTNVKRIGATAYERKIKVDLSQPEVGEMNSIIHGYRI